MLFKGLSNVETVWMSHFDSVSAIGPEFEELGYTVTGDDETPHRNAAIVSDSSDGMAFSIIWKWMLLRAVTSRSELRSGYLWMSTLWDEPILESQIEQIREEVGEQSVFLLASGGVDSPLLQSHAWLLDLIASSCCTSTTD